MLLIISHILSQLILGQGLFSHELLLLFCIGSGILVSKKKCKMYFVCGGFHSLRSPLPSPEATSSEVKNGITGKTSSRSWPSPVAHRSNLGKTYFHLKRGLWIHDQQSSSRLSSVQVRRLWLQPCPFPRCVCAWLSLKLWLQLQSTACSSPPCSWLSFVSESSQGCSHPCCLCTFSATFLSSIQLPINVLGCRSLRAANFFNNHLLSLLVQDVSDRLLYYLVPKPITCELWSWVLVSK